MPLDALNLPPSTSTQDNFDVSDESDIEQPQPRRLCTSASVHPEGSDIAVMLQQQQGLLLSILANQSKMETKQSEFEAKLLALEEKLSSSISGPSPSSEETKPRKRVVTAALTVSIYMYNTVFKNLLVTYTHIFLAEFSYPYTQWFYNQIQA